MIYFDQAASSFPKPQAVTEAMIEALNEVGANPGRGGHLLARKAAEIVNDTRENAAALFGCSDPKKSIFFQNATIALNQAIKGLPWKRGDHIITSSVEHNSLRRPLEYVKQTYGVEVSYVKWNDDKSSFFESITHAVTSSTKLIAMTHASNVTGSILPIQELLNIANKNEILTLVDASQTAGHISISMKEMGINMLAFPGHKGLLGPQGTGMLLLEGDVDLAPLHHGGTGEFSEDVNQPMKYPERLESGTLNTPGIAGLNAALIEYRQSKSEIVPRETILTNQLIKGLKQVDDIICYGPEESELRMPIVAFNYKNIPSQEVAMILDSHYGIAVRAGLHCSPLTHKTLKTTEQGVVRASLGKYNTEKEVEMFLKSINEIVSIYREL